MAGTGIDLTKIPFGVADITIGTGANAITFDGKTYLQADAGELTLTPNYEDIKFEDFGQDTIFDQRLTGWKGSLKFVAAQNDIKVLQIALASTDTITDTTTQQVVGLMDGKIGSSLRDKAQQVTIHPRIMGSDKSLDIVIYKAAANGDFTQSYANEQGKQEIELTVMPRDNFDASKPGNFFYIGPKDPNAAA